MRINQAGDISTLDGTSLKLVDKFTYLGSSVSSTEKDIDTRLTNAWMAIDKQSIIHKNVVSNIKQVLATTPYKNTNYTATCLPSQKLSKLDEPGTYDTAGGAETSS